MAYEAVRFDERQIESAKKAARAVCNVGSEEEEGTGLEAIREGAGLREVESAIRKLNRTASKATLLSSIVLYSVIYSRELYGQSGLGWSEYVAQSKQRLGVGAREVSEMLAAAGFFIENCGRLMEGGYRLTSFRNLSRAYLALKLSGDVEEVIKHLCSGESAEAFKAWYQSLKKPVELEGPSSQYIRTDIVITKSSVTIGGKNLFSVSEKIGEEERKKFMEYVTKIYSTIQEGKEPAVIAVYDRAEERRLVALRDRNRKSR